MGSNSWLLGNKWINENFVIYPVSKEKKNVGHPAKSSSEHGTVGTAFLCKQM